ncbi:MAG: YdbH domain-containing protein [Pseudomonadota bacterium]
MTETTRPHRMLRAWRRAVLALLVLLALGLVFGWLFRIQIAEALGQRACEARGLTCAFDLTKLTLTSATLEGVVVSADTGTAPLAAQQIDLTLDWAGLRPIISTVAVDGARVAATFDGSNLTLGGVETVLRGDRGASEPRIPAINIREGQLELSTPAGTVKGTFGVVLDDRGDGQLRARVQPATLTDGRDTLSLLSGEIDLALRAGQMAGVVDLEIEAGAFGRFVASNVLLRADVAPLSEDNANTVDYRLAAQALSFGEIDMRAATTNGTLVLEGTPLRMADAIANLRQAAGTFEADVLAAPGLMAEAVLVDLDLARSTEGRLAGPVALTAQDTTFAEAGSTGGLAVSGELADLSADRVLFDGQVTLRSASLAPGQIERLSNLLDWPSPVTAHGDALREVLGAAISDFDTGTRLRFERNGPGDVQVQARGATRLTSQTGLTFAVTPFAEGPWFEGTQDGVSMRGAIALGGGGAPEITLQLEDASYRDGASTLRLGEVDVPDWALEGTTFGAGLSRLEVSVGRGNLRLAGRGALRFDGAMGGAEFRGLNLFGAVDAVRASEGWRAQLGGGRCLSLAFDRMQLPGMALGAVTTSLCPQDGRIARQGEGASSGTLSLDAISVPIALGRSEGTMRLPASVLDWSLSERVRIDVALARIGVDLTTGPSELRLTAGESALGALIGGTGLELTGRLRDVVFGGSLIPANASAGRFDFRLSGGDGGLAGTADIASVLISDNRSDPLYAPLVADLTADLLGGAVQMSGPVRLQASGRRVADADIRVVFPDVDGLIRITGRDLDFRPGGLQPSDLSERLRGFFTDTRGALNAEARIEIDAGILSGTGDLTVSNLGFQTVALGRVSRVNGGVVFSDLLALETPPGQRVTIGSVDPGVPLQNGQLSFRLTGGGNATLEEALWPFAGGVLAVEPTRWTLGAQTRRLTVRADRIGLADLTGALELPGFDAEGTVSGRFPIVFRPGSVDVVDARLVADARGGVLRYTGGVGTLAGRENESVSTAFRALENFQFSVLELGANGDLLGDVTVSARLEGRNPDVLDGSPFNFNVEIDSKLGQLLTSARRLSGPDWLAQVRAEQAGSTPP